MKFMTALAWQAIQSINLLKDGEDESGWPINCCPICCGPCDALNEMISDEYMLALLSNVIKSTGYTVDGWDYWSELSDSLHVADIKAMWFKPDGTRKAICMSSDGVDQSDELHRAVRAEIEWKSRVLKD